MAVYLGHRASASFTISIFKQLFSGLRSLLSIEYQSGLSNFFLRIAVSSLDIPRIPNRSPLFVNALFSISITVSLSSK